MSGFEHVQVLSFTLLDNHVEFEQLVNTYGVISSSYAVFLILFTSFCLRMTKETQNKSELGKKS